MDLLGGYGSGSESGDDDSAPTEPVPAFKPSIAVSAAPPTTSSLYDDQPRAAVSAPQPSKAAEVEDEEQERPRLVAPAGPVLADEDTDYGPGPARPPVTAFSDEKEIPSVSNPEVWSKLPAPKAPAARRVIQMRLALHKSLLTKEAQDRDDEDELEAAKARKRARQGGANGKPALLDLLPKPKTALAGSSGGGAAFGAGGGMIDIGDAFKKPAPRPARAAAAAFGGADSDDEDPMARLGPMPEAGAYAAGPIADDGEPLDDVPTGAADESQAAAAPQAAAAAMYYVGDDGGGAGGAGPSSAGYAYGAEQYAVAGASGGDAGQELFQQALFAEQQRAAKRGEAFDMSAIQFKEVNANDLKYMDPSAREAQRSARAALGAEYAAQLRADAKPFEGDKTAKRKHQIGTLFYNAKMKELEILEGKAAGFKAKAESKGKYGW